jgi:ribonuclease P protein component
VSLRRAERKVANDSPSSPIASTAEFPREYRLTRRAEFDAVFAHGQSRAGLHITLIAKPSEAGVPRLGLVVGKKVARSAVRRNYMKRLLRETFRSSREELQPVDLVAVVKRAFNRAAGAAVRGEFSRLTQGYRR